MARFSKERSSHRNLIKIIIPLAVFAVVIAVFAAGVVSLKDQTDTRQKESLLNAINRDIVYCYANEGCYPESLDYMKEHYGLTYDESRFYVDYRVLAANIYPDVTIIETEDRQ